MQTLNIVDHGHLFAKLLSQTKNATAKLLKNEEFELNLKY